jgi:hypothetical protein
VKASTASSLRGQGKEGRMTAWIADVLIVLGLIVMTLGVYGIVRFRGRLHAAARLEQGGHQALIVGAPHARRCGCAGSSRGPLGNPSPEAS